MRPLALTRKKKNLAEVQSDIDFIVQFITLRIQPSAIYLFGSAAENCMTDQSDIDLLIVSNGRNQLRENQKALGPLPAGRTHITELVWVTDEEFERKKNLGGVCQTAYKYGRLLFEREK